MICFFKRFLEPDWKMFLLAHEKFQKVFKKKILELYFCHDLLPLAEVWENLFDIPIPVN